MMTKDIRWHQRFQNYCAALDTLNDCIAISKQRKLSIMEELGLIQAFELVYELGWNCIKDFCESMGAENILGSRDAIRQGFKMQLIEAEKLWLSMVDDRIQTAHTYNKELAQNIAKKITETYYPEFLKLQKILEKKR
jgi:nucleotidyltransferase substrate binding protein (TIGR01987 family)